MAKEKPQDTENTYTSADDFKVIHGIGPGIESRLHKAGVRSYAQLAALTPTEVVSALGTMIGMTVERVTDQDWIGQARELAPLNTPDKPDLDPQSGRQHYATFTVELLLDEANIVRRTRVVFFQADNEDAWAGWDEKRLVEFLVQHSAMQIQTPISKSPQPSVEELAPSTPQISGRPRLKPARVTGLTAHQGRILGRDKPFEIILPFDLADVTLPGHSEIEFKLNLNAKALGRGSYIKLGEAQGRFEPSKENEVTLKCPALGEGVYRIRVDLALNPPMLNAASKGMQMSNLDGGLLRIY
jgi:hypothetical protein